jgi:hypothetical protein
MLVRQLRRFMSPPKCLELDSLTDIHECGLFLKSTGNRDSDGNIIYIIRQIGSGRGLFSLVSSTLCHLHLAERYGLVPVVDFRCEKTEYDDKQFMATDPLNRQNPWDFFFEPVSSLSSESSFQDRTVLASSMGFPDGYPRKMLVSHVQELRNIAVKYIKIAPDLAQEFEKVKHEILSGYRVLGVHFRGQEQKTMPFHPLSPTLAQMYSAIDLAISQYGFNRIFVASEDLDYVDAVMSRYPDKAITLPHFRTRAPINAYRILPREKHKYLLGKEILFDAFILSACDGLVSSTSNVTEFARAYNNGNYKLDLVIDNGLNVANPKVARHLWSVKSFLPAKLGGFSFKAIQHFPDINSH